MEIFKKHLYKWLLPKLLAKSCEERIPRSGEEGEKVNCYVVALNNEKMPFFVATGCESGSLLVGKKYDGHSYSEKYTIQYSEIKNYDFVVRHFYGLSEVRYSSIYDLAWNYITRIVYIKIQIARAFSSIGQFIYNSKTLVTKKRMELLNFMLDDQISRYHDGIGIIDLMTKLYTIKWVLHPSSNDQQKKLEIFLESLVESGDLKEINHEYVVTGKAISTIEQYEEEERRHLGILKLQRRMVFLTIILVIVGLLQAGLIKLPTLIDLTNHVEHNQTIHQDGNERTGISFPARFGI